MDIHLVDYKQIIEQTLSGILIIGQDRKIQYHNNTALKLFDCSSVDLYLQSFDIFLHHDYHEICKKRLHNLFNHEQHASEMEQKLITFKGRIIDVEIKAVPYYSSNQVLALVFIRDITKQKNAERLLAHKDKLGSIGQISAGIAHEVRNPLTAVKGFVQLLKEETNHEYIEPIENELEHALSTLNNLLQVSKPDLLNETLSKMNLCQELDSIIYLFQQQLYRIEIKKVFIDKDYYLYAKRNILIKCFFNLIKNAIEAIEDRGVITVEHYISDSMINIKISDTGVGISQEELRMLGTPFFSTKDTGTGMGLTQVFTTIQDHNGQIQIDSKKGVGTTFHIILPMG